MLNLCIDHKDVSFGINEDIARNKVPYFVGVVGIASLSSSLLKAQCCHIGINHNLGSRMGISDSWLDNDRLNRPTIEAGKAIERISGIREDGVMHQTTYILLAISRLRFMYCAKSLEFIGDCCDAAIFRILRSVTSLWNWLRNVIIHLFLNISGKDSAGRVQSLFSRLNIIFKCKDTMKSLIKQIKLRNYFSMKEHRGSDSVLISK